MWKTCVFSLGMMSSLVFAEIVVPSGTPLFPPSSINRQFGDLQLRGFTLGGKVFF